MSYFKTIPDSDSRVFLLKRLTGLFKNHIITQKAGAGLHSISYKAKRPGR
jgi:hypothetical protein